MGLGLHHTLHLRPNSSWSYHPCALHSIPFHYSNKLYWILAVLLERIWTCGRKTILKMQGREGFRTVPGEDYNEDDDQMRQMGEFGDVEIEEMDGKGRGD